MKILVVTIITLFSGMFVDLNAQIAIAVANDENQSALVYEVVWNTGSSCEIGRKAIKALEDKGYKNVIHQAGSVNHGHDLQNGYWVVVKQMAKLYDGTVRIGYGLGASSNSYNEAEERAQRNMISYFYDWSESYGFTIADRGTY